MAAADAAKAVAPQTFKQFASTTGAKMAEGAVSGGMSGTVESMTNDKTWAEGFDRGLKKTLETGVKGAATGAAMNALPPAVAGLVTAAGVLDDLLTDQVIDALPPGEAKLDRITFHASGTTPATPAAPATPAKTGGPPVQGNWGKAYEAYIESLLWRGQLTGVPQMDFVIQAAHNASDNGIDRIGLVITPDGQINVYHFEMKWRNPAESGPPHPAELTVPDENVEQEAPGARHPVGGEVDGRRGGAPVQQHPPSGHGRPRRRRRGDGDGPWPDRARVRDHAGDGEGISPGQRHAPADRPRTLPRGHGPTVEAVDGPDASRAQHPDGEEQRPAAGTGLTLASPRARAPRRQRAAAVPGFCTTSR